MYSEQVSGWFLGPPMWSLLVLSVSTWVFPRFCCLLQQSRISYVRLIRECKMFVRERLVVCLHMRPCTQPSGELKWMDVWANGWMDSGCRATSYDINKWNIKNLYLNLQCLTSLSWLCVTKMSHTVYRHRIWDGTPASFKKGFQAHIWSDFLQTIITIDFFPIGSWHWPARIFFLRYHYRGLGCCSPSCSCILR